MPVKNTTRKQYYDQACDYWWHRLTQLSDLTIIKRDNLTTPYGSPSSDFITGELDQKTVIFLARHGCPHTIAPHNINYRANIWGLKQLGVEQIIAVAAVGGITEKMAPAHIAIPDQIIDFKGTSIN
jgi:5'-methylthioinosine phosphorylase